jgi:hypothetical protein
LVETREVYTLVIECGRRPGDYLPQRATGARLLCYVLGRDEDDAVSSAVAVVWDAGMAPLAFTNYGPLSERLAEGSVGEAERLLIDRAEREDTVVIGELTPLFEKGPGSH